MRRLRHFQLSYYRMLTRLIIGLGFLSGFVRADIEKPNLLLISSYHPNFPTFYQQIDGILDVLPASKYNLDVEFMDSKRFPGDLEKEEFKQHLESKLKRLPDYDLVFTSDDNALHFAVENKELLFPDTPVVFFGVNDIEFATRQNENPEITGVVESASISQTIQLGRQLLPSVKTFYAVSDSTTSGKADLRAFLNIQSDFQDLRLEGIDLSKLSWDELSEEIISLPGDSAILLLSAYHDRLQVSKPFSESLHFILKSSNVPVFHLWEHGLNDGIIGGVVISHHEQGKKAAQMAELILNGRDISRMEVEINSPNREVLDYNALRKYKIFPANIPPSAEIVNRPFSLYRAKKELFWTAIIIFMLMAGLILFLSINILQRRRAEGKLYRSRQMFKALFNESLQFCGIVSLDGRLLTPNESSLEIINAKAVDVIGCLFWETPWWAGTGSEAELKEGIRRAAQGETVRFLARHNTAEKGEIIVDFSLKPIIEKGQTTQLLAESRDITELREMQEKLKQNEKMEALGMLAGGIAHDFNNMLAGMIGFAELLAEELADKPALSNFAEHIISTGERAAELTDQLLSFARKGKQYSVAIPIRKAVADTILLLEHSLDKKIKIQTKYNEDGIVLGDPAQLQSAFLNLGVNSRDAMPEGGTLSFSTRKIEIDDDYCRTSHFELVPGSYVEITVHDTGKGIPPEIIDRIFEPFFTTKEIGRGTGLGLAAVYGAITDHRGELTVISELDHGTTFRILLPLADEETESPVPASAPLASASMGDTILVVEDDDVVRTIAQAMLETLGYQVIAARNGNEGVELYQQNKDRIVLSIVDVIMPEMNGMEVLQKIRSMNVEAKVIIVSGYSADSTQSDYLDAGAKAFLVKPYRKAELDATIREFLD